MTMTLPRFVMVLAVNSLGIHHRTWAQATLAEFEVAEADGKPYRFAFGCLLGAWRMLPLHIEGRFTLVSYTLALGLLLPMAAMLATAATFGFPFVEAREGIGEFLSGSGTYQSLLNAGSQFVGPGLTLVVLLVAACHLPLAWWVVEHDWERVAMAMRLGAAAMTTLVIVTPCAGLNAAT